VPAQLHTTCAGLATSCSPVWQALSAIKDNLDYKRFCKLPLGLVLEYKNVLIYSRLVNGHRLS